MRFLPIVMSLFVMSAQAGVDFSRVQYESADPTGSVAGKKYFERTVVEGVSRLERLNPSLANRVTLAFAETPLIVSERCSPSDHTFGSRGCYLPGKGDIVARICVWQPTFFDRSEPYPLDFDLSDFYRETENASRALFFYEVLHFAGIDAKAVKKHHSLGRFGLRKCDDVIY
ncbi:MAG: hypothetical protein EOP09_06085, partial [Proteobacteria bacterium]